MTEWTFPGTPRGVPLRVCEWGAPAPGRPPILVLHGFLEQGAAWDAVAGDLPGRVLAPDLRGHGLSGHVGAGGFYHFWDYVPDVLGLIDHLGGRVDLVGHSMGGTISVLAAGLRPDAVRRLVSVEGLGPPDGEGTDAERADRFVQAMQDPPRHPLLADLDDAARRLRRWNTALSDDTARRLAARITRPAAPDDAFDGEWTPGALLWTWDSLHRARAPYPFRASMFRSFLRELTMPVLHVLGAESWFRVPDLAEREAAVPDLRRVEIPGGGHLLHHDQPAALAAEIAAFLGAP